MSERDENRPWHQKHGTYDSYNNHNCRCRACKNAFAEHFRRYLARRAASTPCAVIGCDGGLYAKGLCKAHYERSRSGLPVNVRVARRPTARGAMPTKRR